MIYTDQDPILLYVIILVEKKKDWYVLVKWMGFKDT